VNARTARRVGWGSVTLASGLMIAASALIAWGGGRPPAGAPTSPTAATGPVFLLAIAVPLVALVGGTGTLIVGRYPRNALGWMFIGFAVLTGLATLAYAYGYAGLIARPGSLPGAEQFELLGELLWLPMIGIQAVGVLVLFPEGRAVSPARRRILTLGAAGLVVYGLGSLIAPTLYTVEVENPLAVGPPKLSTTLVVIGTACVLASAVAATVSLIRRFRRSRGDERQQMKWFVYAAGLALAVEIPLFFSETWSVWVQALFALSLALLPVAVGIAILRFRLYDIDVVINRTVVYGILAGFITLVFLVLVAGVGTIVGGSNTFLAAVAAALVALVFHPVRRWAQHLANRLVHGERATPYEVLSGFSERLAETYSIDDVLPRTARVLAEGLGAQDVAIVLRDDGRRETVARWPANTDGRRQDARPFEVRHQGELLGEIAVSMPPGEPLDAAREKLVRDVAAQAGLMLRNVSLVADLRASRARLVAAQDEERRRLERNIHDGAQQQLVALTVKLRLADTLVGKDDAAAHEMLGELARETNEALEDLRDLARGIYPPLLADQGLTAALESHARRVPVPVAIETDSVGRYAQEIEAAVYFSCLEALQNVAKYAEATEAIVRLGQDDGSLTFEVVDDGVGFDPAAAPRGTGLQGIADRLAALGGELSVRSAPGNGTTVAGVVPVEVGMG
jgi:signal transduction histidine kinase